MGMRCPHSLFKAKFSQLSCFPWAGASASDDDKAFLVFLGYVITYLRQGYGRIQIKMRTPTRRCLFVSWEANIPLQLIELCSIQTAELKELLSSPRRWQRGTIQLPDNSCQMLFKVSFPTLLLQKSHVCPVLDLPAQTVCINCLRISQMGIICLYIGNWIKSLVAS